MKKKETKNKGQKDEANLTRIRKRRKVKEKTHEEENGKSNTENQVSQQ